MNGNYNGYLCIHIKGREIRFTTVYKSSIYVFFCDAAN